MIQRQMGSMDMQSEMMLMRWDFKLENNRTRNPPEQNDGHNLLIMITNDESDLGKPCVVDLDLLIYDSWEQLEYFDYELNNIYTDGGRIVERTTSPIPVALSCYHNVSDISLHHIVA